MLYHFLRRYCRQVEKQVDGFSDDALEYLINHDWPSNVRQLKNVVERLVIMADDKILGYENLTDHLEADRNQTQGTIPETRDELKAIKRHLLEKRIGQIERAFLQKALSGAQGNITQAPYNTSYSRIIINNTTITI